MSNKNMALTRNKDLIPSLMAITREPPELGMCIFFHILFSVTGMFQGGFTPTRETSKHQNEETFLTEYPRNVISDGRIHNVPYVVGVVAYESAFFTSKLATIIFACLSNFSSL